MKNKYNIGIVVSRIDFGAAELLEVNLAIKLSELNHNVILMPQYSLEKFNDIEFDKQLNKYHLRVERLNFDKPLNCLLKIIKIRKLKLDFIISHSRGGDFLSSFISAYTDTKHIKAF